MNKTIKVKIVSEAGEKSILENIEIRVLESKIISQDGEMTEYENIFSHSVFTDENGECRFEITFENFVAEVNLASLPSNYGLTCASHFFNHNNDECEFVLKHVEKIEIGSIDINIPEIRFLDDSNNNLSVNYEILDSSFNMDGDPLVAKNIVVKYSIKNNGELQEIKNIIDLTTMSEYSKISIMKQLCLIDNYHELIMLLSTNKKNAQMDSDTTIVERILQLAEECKSSNNKLDSNIESCLRKAEELRVSRPTYSVPGTVETTSAYGSYQIHYENDPTSPNYISSSKISTIKSYVEDAYNYYCNTNSFLAPTKETNETYYHIYLVDIIDPDKDPAGRTTPDNGGSFIRIKLDGSTTPNNNHKRTISHEMFHSIAYRYNGGSSFSQSGGQWLSEALASFASIQFVSGENTIWTKGRVKEYYSTPSISLKTEGSTTSPTKRFYGQLVFLKYIYEKHGGWDTIKAIMSALSSFQNSDADKGTKSVNAGLVEKNTNFATAFAGCARYNCDPEKYSNVSVNQWTSEKKLSDGTPIIFDGTVRANSGTTTSMTSLGRTLPQNSSVCCNVFATTSSTTLTITISNITNPTNLSIGAVKYKGNDSDSSPNRVISHWGESSATSRTLTMSSFTKGSVSSVIKKATIVFVNKNYLSSDSHFSATFEVQ